MKLRTILATLAILTLVSGVAYAASRFSATASEFDPGNTFLVQAQWLDGIGCPTNARIANPNADFTGVGSIGSYGDPGCPTGDSSDTHNQGLLLVKTGPTANFAAAQADTTVIAAFAVGFVSFVSPCVLPLVPSAAVASPAALPAPRGTSVAALAPAPAAAPRKDR